MGLSRTTTQPLYDQVLEQIRSRVESGEWAKHSRVPSERQLAELLGVSRITVRHAVRLAVEEGLLEQRRGVGTFVASRDKVAQDLSEVRSFELTLAQQGYIAGTQILGTTTVIADLTLAGVLNLPPATPVRNLQLLGIGDASPVVYYDSYFAPPLGQEMSAAAEEFHARGTAFSTLDLYRHESISRDPERLRQTIDAVLATNELSGHLGIPVGAPILAIESVISDAAGPLEFRRAYYRADRYTFALERRLSPQPKRSS